MAERRTSPVSLLRGAREPMRFQSRCNSSSPDMPASSDMSDILLPVRSRTLRFVHLEIPAMSLMPFSEACSVFRDSRSLDDKRSIRPFQRITHRGLKSGVRKCGI